MTEKKRKAQKPPFFFRLLRNATAEDLQES